MRVPSNSTISSKNSRDRLASFSKVEPRVITMPASGLFDRLISSFTIQIGRGVVVTTVCGVPCRSPKRRLFHDSRAYRHDAISSHHAASCCGPRSRSGSSAV